MKLKHIWIFGIYQHMKDERNLRVQCLPVQLFNMNEIISYNNKYIENILGIPYVKKTMLIEWININATTADNRHLKYLNFPLE